VYCQMKKKLSCILFIDDDEPTNFLNKLIVEDSNCTDSVQVVQSGQEALNYLTQAGTIQNNGHQYPKPELIFLDINMPGMDGWEFLESYQKLPGSQKANIIMVMLTTSLNPDDEKIASLHATISGFEHKPLQPEMLERILRENFPDHF
jgi:CheY-like chemotaxis protein